jgi:hypothetical protein
MPQANETELVFPDWFRPSPMHGPRHVSQVIYRFPESLEELIVALSKSPTAWIWRGQASSSWGLTSRLGREFDQLPKPEEDGVSLDYIDIENRLIGFFKERARRVLASAPDDHDLLGWLALMQHYGAPTRLLDWTASPFVALYFAYASLDSDEPAALWALNAYFCRRGLAGSLIPYRGWDHLGIMKHSTTDSDGQTTERTPSLETTQRDRENAALRWIIESAFPWPLPVIPFDADARMAAQQTVLTAIGDLSTDVDWKLLRFEQWQRGAPRPSGGLIRGSDSTIWPLLEPSELINKFVLPASWRSEALRALASMGIDGSTLFPGLDGVGRETSNYARVGIWQGGTPREVISDSFGFF